MNTKRIEARNKAYQPAANYKDIIGTIATWYERGRNAEAEEYEAMLGGEQTLCDCYRLQLFLKKHQLDRFSVSYDYAADIDRIKRHPSEAAEITKRHGGWIPLYLMACAQYDRI